MGYSDKEAIIASSKNPQQTIRRCLLKTRQVDTNKAAKKWSTDCDNNIHTLHLHPPRMKKTRASCVQIFSLEIEKRKEKGTQLNS